MGAVVVYTGDMEVTWLGNASIRVAARGATLLFDPFIPLPGASYEMPAEHFLPASHIFITHGHPDHAQSVPTLVDRGAGEVYATASPCANLREYGVPQERLHVIEPDSHLEFNEDGGAGGVSVSVNSSRHIHFDVPLLLGTLFNPLILRYWENAKALAKSRKVFKESGETVIYEVSDGTTLITILGSMSLCSEERYTPEPSLLVLPYQGNSRLLPIALTLVESLAPRAVLLDHFNDAFPPLTRTIDVAPFVQAMQQQHPEVPVIVPQVGQSVETPVVVPK